MTIADSNYEDRTEAPHGERRTEGSAIDLVAKLLRDVNDLISKESRLVRAEVSDRVSDLGNAIGYLIAGASCMLVAMIVLAGAIVAALEDVVGAGWAALIVGATIAVIGAFLANAGAKKLKPSHFYPERSARQLREDAELAREQAR